MPTFTPPPRPRPRRIRRIASRGTTHRARIHTSIPTCMHTSMHTSMQTSIHISVHTSMYTPMHSPSPPPPPNTVALAGPPVPRVAHGPRLGGRGGARRTPPRVRGGVCLDCAGTTTVVVLVDEVLIAAAVGALQLRGLLLSCRRTDYQQRKYAEK